MIKQMDKESIFMSMEPNTKDLGKMTCKTGLELKAGLMDLNMKDYIKKA
jgi:hypothetical protein